MSYLADLTHEELATEASRIARQMCDKNLRNLARRLKQAVDDEAPSRGIAQEVLQHMMSSRGNRMADKRVDDMVLNCVNAKQIQKILDEVGAGFVMTKCGAAWVLMDRGNVFASGDFAYIRGRAADHAQSAVEIMQLAGQHKVAR